VITVVGVGAGIWVVGPVDMESPLILMLFELTLALVLFSDASRIDISRLRRGYSWPLRMLALGLPVSILVGTVLFGWILGVSLGVALLLGVILAPTDAALAEPVLVSDVVPNRIRQALNIESGLNDGLVVPVLLITIGIIDAGEGSGVGGGTRLIISQIGFGILGGVVVGWLGARLIARGTESGWMNPLHQRIAAVVLALGCFAGVQLIGGSGFVATFIAGGLVSHLIQTRCEYLYEFVEEEGHTLVMVALLIFGAGPAADLLQRGVPVEAMVVAFLSLMVVRPLAIGISLIGQGLNTRTVAFLGWFGPRGLATIVFLLVAARQLDSLDQIVIDTVTLTVLTSIVVHGVSAYPMSRWLAGMPLTEDMPEMGEVFPHPMRR
ncbi:MAG: cation:proton antiporter, partial [Actinomycetota bacterium]